MNTLGDVSTHLQLVRRMARATGVDLDAAHQRGALADAEWAATVTRCRGCQCTEDCSRWLAEGELAAAGPRPAPQGCENKALFATLSTEQDEWDS
ncbi:hypothetical protein ATO6_00640 [Oceanicola sp. 22II-s10i]|uniref:DUF6455 family protein n=1 Tax=Oceanicola sp. 22II-s10i TaxID=1317116 RepID=UPI000B521C96|nr:DUF6455 family protein [Oceanicola sp. 22II-s10i]OWU85493.1 hypothetical protein ATO6_00640 [Oceanicola sp. 22II-s10i]